MIAMIFLTVITGGPFIQWLAAIPGLAIKPAYMILTLILIFLLRSQKRRSLVLIRWALLTFFAGEAFCAANYLLVSGTSEALDILHGAGMVGLSIFLPWGLFALLDEYVLRFSDERANCALLRLCGLCWKQTDVSCGLKKIFQFAAPSLAIIALMPLAVPLKPSHYTMVVFDIDVHFIFSAAVLLWEQRIYPILAALLLLSSLVFLRGGHAGLKRAQIPFFTGLGFMLYPLFRFFLFYSYDGLPYWANFWEELTELMMTVGLGIFFMIFRRQLGLSLKLKPVGKK